MSDAVLSIVSHDVLTIHDSDAQKLDRKRARLLVADSLIIRYFEPLDPSEWSNPHAQELDFIAQSHEEILLVIVRTYDAENDGDAALVAVRHDPSLDSNLVARLKQIVTEFANDDPFVFSLHKDPEHIEGVIVDVISTPERIRIVEHHNIAHVNLPEFISTRPDPEWVTEMLEDWPEEWTEDEDVPL